VSNYEEAEEEGRRRRSVMNSPNGDGCRPDMGEEEIDPLDAFTNSTVLPDGSRSSDRGYLSANKSPPTVRLDDDSDSGDEDADETAHVEEEEEEEDDDDDQGNDVFMKYLVIKKRRRKATAKMTIVDRCEVDYPPFRKSFYIESPEISKTTGEEVAAYRKQWEIKVHGAGDVPKPVTTWVQCGLTSKAPRRREEEARVGEADAHTGAGAAGHNERPRLHRDRQDGLRQDACLRPPDAPARQGPASVGSR
jgi:hypothetical protein